MTTFSEMLEEMVVRILSRLPPKSLVRFRSVSKLWCTIINDTSFMGKNLSNSVRNKFARATCILVKYTLLKDRSITDEKEIAALMKTFEDYYNGMDLLLSLLHICNDDDGDEDNLTYVVEDLELPFPSAEDEDEYTAPWSKTTAVGFGLDSKAKEYKIVRVVETTSGVCNQHPTRAEVYTMGANAWRELENVDIGCHVYWAPSFNLHFKGTCYWWAFAPIDKELILTFDMTDELFHRIPVPDCFDFYNDIQYRSLDVSKDSIVLLTYQAGEVPKSFDIWMMDESAGVKGSWTKYLTFGPVEDIQFPLVFLNSEELLMVTNGSRLVSYNLGTKKLNHFPVQDVQGARNMQAVNFINSIISVEGTPACVAV